MKDAEGATARNLANANSNSFWIRSKLDRCLNGDRHTELWYQKMPSSGDSPVPLPAPSPAMQPADTGGFGGWLAHLTPLAHAFGLGK